MYLMCEEMGDLRNTNTVKKNQKEILELKNTISEI